LRQNVALLEKFLWKLTTLILGTNVDDETLCNKYFKHGNLIMIMNISNGKYNSLNAC